MDISDITTSPLLSHAQEPLLLIIDEYEERCLLLARLLAFANYRTYAAKTAQQASSWYGQHTIPPEVILFGYMSSLEHFFFRRLRAQISTQQGKEIPAIALGLYFPEVFITGISSAWAESLFCFGLLELLWQIVPRYD
jgi:PleD family two-component response regulator